MANYSHIDFKRYGPDRAASNANTIALVVNPLKTNSLPELQAKIIAQAALLPADWSFVLEGQDLKVTVNGKSGIDPSGTAAALDDIAVAVFDSVGSVVYLVQDANDRVITNEIDDTVNIPALVFYVREVTPVV